MIPSLRRGSLSTASRCSSWPVIDLSAADVGTERLLAKHHVEAAVSVRQDALALQARRRALLCVLWDAHEVDEGKQDRDGILTGLQQTRDDGGFVDPEQPCPLIHGRRGLLAAPGTASHDATPFGELRLDAPDGRDEVG